MSVPNHVLYDYPIHNMQRASAQTDTIVLQIDYATYVIFFHTNCFFVNIDNFFSPSSSLVFGV